MRLVTAHKVYGLGPCADRAPEPIALNGLISNNNYYVLTYCWMAAVSGCSVPLGSCNTEAVPRNKPDRSLRTDGSDETIESRRIKLQHAVSQG